MERARTVTVTYDPHAVSEDAIRQAIGRANQEMVRSAQQEASGPTDILSPGPR
ncbi:MAG: hypothetical protein HYY02_11625 [Chloroflexi bacterium]|nr:hypothetical protein [Chloroflexota bacterium]